MNYHLEISYNAQVEIKRLPGYVRQRVRRAIGAMKDDPRPQNSRKLDFAMATTEARRLRIDRWRVIYAVIETDMVRMVAVVAVRQRPPYNYGDVRTLFSDLASQ